MQQHPRYQVFVSSTFSDLDTQRKEAIEAVYESGHIPIALERFPPDSADNVQVIRTAMAQCQVFLLILGHRYGQLLPDSSMSYTEYEYRLAQEHGLYTLIFALDESMASNRRKALDEANARDLAERRNFGRMKQFLEHVASNHFCAYWTDSQFRYKVGVALARELVKCNKPGFIPQPDDPTLLDTKSEFIVDIVATLKGFTKLYERCNTRPAVKRQIVRFFIEQYMDAILRSDVSLFFESGSTVAFLAKEMAPHLKTSVAIRAGEPNVAITTNNVLAYLLLWLSARVPCSQFPWSPPFERTYGALYGGIANLQDRHPDYRQPPLDSYARAEIEQLLTAPFAPRAEKKRITLLLGAASGLQLQRPRRIDFKADVPEATRAELVSQICSCFGPHVGSYHNRVFKRFMYATKLPVVLFLDGDKIDCPVEAGKCHYILDSSFTWDQFTKTHPVAFCIGCAEPVEDGAMTKPDMVTYFSDRGFSIVDGNAASSVGLFVARNQPFIEQFEKRCDSVSQF